ncbi:hypothetical protein T439DRAFT_371403 [Meredithblackwellia eburnea MCA 4105]
MRFIPTFLAFSLCFIHSQAFPHLLRQLNISSDTFVFPRTRASSESPSLIERQTQLPISISLPPLPIPGLNIPRSLDLPYLVSVGTKVIPDAAHPFKAPGPTDRRGGCPGLNIMSNYGCKSSPGIVTAGELIYGMVEMLGYGVDFATALVALALRSGAMDPTTLKMSIGQTDSRTNGPFSLVLGQAPGLFDYAAHNRYEVDGSMAYDDSYFHRTSFNSGAFFNGNRFATMQALADSQFGGLYSMEFQQEHRYRAYQDCVASNPTCSWFMGMSSTDPATGQISPPDSASVQSFFGAQPSGSTFVKVPEKLKPGPDGHWYRRSTPLTTAEIVSNGFIAYFAHPVLFGSNDGTHVNSFSPTVNQLDPTMTEQGLICLLLNAIQVSSSPLCSLSVNRFQHRADFSHSKGK